MNRNEEGKEIRYPVILSAAEKEIARKVCLAFKQTVCGFDLLRVQVQAQYREAQISIYCVEMDRWRCPQLGSCTRGAGKRVCGCGEGGVC